MWQFEPIAYIKNCSYKEKFGTPRQGALNPQSKAFVKFEAQLPAGSLEGLEGFSHLWLIWVFHANGLHKIKGKVHAPRLGGKSVGVFASRTPHRPNPIGLSLVRIESVEEKGIWISGVDLIESTPVLDVKPYIAEDQAANPKFGWIDSSTLPKREIRWEPELRLNLKDRLNELTEKELQLLISLIESTLALDPRPVIYKQLEKDQGYTGPYGLRIDDYNVKFTSNASGFEIIDVQCGPFVTESVHQPTESES